MGGEGRTGVTRIDHPAAEKLTHGEKDDTNRGSERIRLITLWWARSLDLSTGGKPDTQTDGWQDKLKETLDFSKLNSQRYTISLRGAFVWLMGNRAVQDDDNEREKVEKNGRRIIKLFPIGFISVALI